MAKTPLTDHPEVVELDEAIELREKLLLQLHAAHQLQQPQNSKQN